MTTATLQTMDVLIASREAANRQGLSNPQVTQPGTAHYRLAIINSLAIAAHHHGEPTMRVSPEDFTLMSDAFWDHKNGRLK